MGDHLVFPYQRTGDVGTHVGKLRDSQEPQKNKRAGNRPIAGHAEGDPRREAEEPSNVNEAEQVCRNTEEGLYSFDRIAELEGECPSDSDEDSERIKGG